MNIKRGLFRLWLVLSLFWVIGAGVVGSGSIKSDKWWKGDEWWEKAEPSFLPVRCEDARGTINVDYEKLDAFEPWNQYRNPSTACYFTIEKFRALFPEYKDQSREEISKKLYDRIGWEPVFDGDRYEHTKIVAAVAFGPPLVLLIIGGLIGWAFAGFKPSTRKI
ncbi:hypothetical protein FHT82_001653 [Rhizobium sp. BK275]|uniref:hypothetical protein n=1 Tax=Rhizobium sp. BK275 TaxID=2587077 RepID=UPI00160ACA72|nr:hypothetical protein [Rhizobium sp. BK275]MBB3388930.1 hypothetical protein [Rhizobium sp. BK275]